MLEGMRWMMLIAVLASVGCRGVRQDDLNAWIGVHVNEVQTHALFSTIPKSVEDMGGGKQLWTYSNCGTGRTVTVCTPVGQNVVCSGGHEYTSCCHNQFFVERDRVSGYRVTGKCYTDCSIRPASRPCGAPPAPLARR